MCNTSSRVNSTSKYLGVSQTSKYKYWIVQLTTNYKVMHFGYYKSEDEAALVYNREVVRYHGEFANLNILNKHKIKTK